MVLSFRYSNRNPVRIFLYLYNQIICVRWLLGAQLLTYAFIRLFMYVFVYSFIYLFVHSFICCDIYSLLAALVSSYLLGTSLDYPCSLVFFKKETNVCSC